MKYLKLSSSLTSIAAMCASGLAFAGGPVGPMTQPTPSLQSWHITLGLVLISIAILWLPPVFKTFSGISKHNRLCPTWVFTILMFTPLLFINFLYLLPAAIKKQFVNNEDASSTALWSRIFGGLSLISILLLLTMSYFSPTNSAELTTIGTVIKGVIKYLILATPVAWIISLVKLYNFRKKYLAHS